MLAKNRTLLQVASKTNLIKNCFVNIVFFKYGSAINLP